MYYHAVLMLTRIFLSAAPAPLRPGILGGDRARCPTRPGESYRGWRAIKAVRTCWRENTHELFRSRYRCACCMYLRYYRVHYGRVRWCKRTTPKAVNNHGKCAPKQAHAIYWNTHWHCCNNAWNGQPEPKGMERGFSIPFDQSRTSIASTAPLLPAMRAFNRMMAAWMELGTSCAIQTEACLCESHGVEPVLGTARMMNGTYHLRHEYWERKLMMMTGPLRFRTRVHPSPQALMAQEMDHLLRASRTCPGGLEVLLWLQNARISLSGSMHGWKPQRGCLATPHGRVFSQKVTHRNVFRLKILHQKVMFVR